MVAAVKAEVTLSDVIQAARDRGLQGVTVIHQGGTRKPYAAICIDRRGVLSDPRGWDTHDTPEAALADLHRQLTAE